MNRLMSMLAVAVTSGVALAQEHPAVEAVQEAASDHAASGSHSEAGVMDFSWLQFASTLLAFGIVFFLLSKYAWPKIMKGLEDREHKIRSEVFAAEEARKSADVALKEYEKSVSQARAEAAQMIEKTKAEQTRMAAELRTQAEADLTQMREAARRSIEAAKRAALNEIYTEAASLATHVATRILQREVSEEDQKRLVEESVEGFAKAYAP